MLPLLTLPLGNTGAGTKRKREDAIYFKAYKKSDYRMLSNLFGPVEWKFQAGKFKPGSGVREWLLENTTREWTKDEFNHARKAMNHNGKLESYVTSSGAIASGLLAQMCSLIARNPASLDARTRLKYILNQNQRMSVDEAQMWAAENVMPELTNEAKDSLMLSLLREKFQDDKYKTLLMSTEDVPLHESRGRGAPNRYEFHPLSDAQLAENAQLTSLGSEPKWSEGGDVLGRLMTIVREELRAS